MSSATAYAYNAVGNRSAMTHANGTQVDYVFDELNRLTDLSHKNSGGVTLKSYSYSLLPNGKRSKIEEANGRTTDYQYNDLYRLTSEAIFDPVNSSHNATYTYDKVGNRTFEEVNGVSTAYTYNDNDWLLQTGGTTYTHDANGNTESQTLDSVVTTYTYNAKNELIGSDEAGLATAYLYNVDGVRVGKGDASGQTLFTTDSNRAYAQVLTEHVDGTEQVRYTYGDDLISQKRGTETNTYHYDGLGSTRALSDSTGTITDEYDYDAFGEVLNQTGTTENDYLFTGEQFDTTLDQYYLRARYYDQSIGRFTQMDTWQGNNSDPVTLHKYLYANVDPVNMVDPSGRFTMGGFSAASNIQVNLGLLQAETGLNIFSGLATGDVSQSAGAAGFGVLASLTPGLLKFVGKKINSTFIGNGKVAYLISKRPKQKEIDAAEYLAANQGARIYIRGGKSTEGADFFLNGKKWELKTLNSASDTAVSGGIRTSIKRKQSELVIIDGLKAGLSKKTLLKGIERAQRNGAYPHRVKAILGDGSIIDWPY